MIGLEQMQQMVEAANAAARENPDVDQIEETLLAWNIEPEALQQMSLFMGNLGTLTDIKDGFLRGPQDVPQTAATAYGCGFMLGLQVAALSMNERGE